jgi:hypothetical protein
MTTAIPYDLGRKRVIDEHIKKPEEDAAGI